MILKIILFICLVFILFEESGAYISLNSNKKFMTAISSNTNASQTKKISAERTENIGISYRETKKSVNRRRAK
ncbi:MAG: hypothetical protein LBH29_02165 [Elusimicrobiota bacterium]|jgi:hypothetical protein|nr:hypothetical protein [Elusimicrobiota bacterium]